MLKVAACHGCRPGHAPIRLPAPSRTCASARLWAVARTAMLLRVETPGLIRAATLRLKKSEVAHGCSDESKPYAKTQNTTPDPMHSSLSTGFFSFLFFCLSFKPVLRRQHILLMAGSGGGVAMKYLNRERISFFFIRYPHCLVCPRYCNDMTGLMRKISRMWGELQPVLSLIHWCHFLALREQQFGSGLWMMFHFYRG